MFNVMVKDSYILCRRRITESKGK